MTEKRRCTKRTKAGKACRGTPIAATDYETCVSHAPEAVKTELGFGGSENARKGGEATRVPKLTELLREKVEARAEEIVEKLLDGLEAQKGLVVGNGPDAYVEMVPDRSEVARTLREIWDRLEGRPKTHTELSGSIDHRGRDQLVREVERLTERLAEARLNGERDRAAA